MHVSLSLSMIHFDQSWYSKKNYIGIIGIKIMVCVPDFPVIQAYAP